MILNAWYTSPGTGSGSGSVTFTEEVPTGSVNGINVTFTLSSIPDTLFLFRNGIKQTILDDYTLSSNTITFLTAPLTGDSLYGVYN